MARFQYKTWKGTIGPFTAERAVEHQTERAGLLANGSIETLEARVAGLIEIVGRLLDTMPPEQVAQALGDEWSVVDDGET